MQYSTLISTQELAGNLHRSDVAVLDCRFDLMNTEAGAREYAAGHIPGALYAHLDRDLSGPTSAVTGRHPLPPRDRLARRLGEWGIGNAMQVVAYDADNGMYAARLWWLLRWLGHEPVAVLDGGLKAWLAAGHALEPALPGKTAPDKPVAVFRPAASLTAVWAAEDVAERVQSSDWRVLDARAPQRYAGEVEPIDPVAGHIPGAHNYPLGRSLQPEGRFLPPAELRRRLQETVGQIPTDKVIAMCGSGVTACHVLLALEVAGLSGAGLYPGSWSEWIRDPARPVQLGAEP
jgi:thiosulfate/3-mercaptopyruvate sulfurtransferase